MRTALIVAPLVVVAACAPAPERALDSPSALSGAIDHDISTSLPSADRNLRATIPGRPPPVQTGVGMFGQ